MNGKAKIIGAAAAGIVIIAVVAWFLIPSDDVTPPSEQTPAAETGSRPEPSPTPTLREQLSARLQDVTLATSDEAVRELVAEITSQPDILAWVASDDLIRRFTATVDNLANGRSPRSHLDFLRPSEPFAVRERTDTWTIDPASYRRYDRITTAFTAVDTAGISALYGELRPLVGEAYREIAPPDSDFDVRLGQAIDHLLATPVVEGPIQVQPKVVTYTYVDPELEGLSDAQRALLRFGPDNVRAIKAKLRELRAAILTG